MTNKQKVLLTLKLHKLQKFDIQWKYFMSHFLNKKGFQGVIGPELGNSDKTLYI